ncbi:MAG: hypothetical protein SV239_13270 [Thermodesulfobacteriota bacterium]|jgi:hypothetical protein|nr:hypothetical protein [Thermodesulfobacteriota bacterium]
MNIEGRPGWSRYCTVILLLVALWGSSGGVDDEEVTPEQVLNEARVDLLAAEDYLFPATIDPDSPPVLLVLRRWDRVFAGAPLGAS